MSRKPTTAAVLAVATLAMMAVPFLAVILGMKSASLKFVPETGQIEVTAARICIEKSVTPPGGAASLAALKGQLWSPGTTLRVRFLQGSARQRRLTMAAFREWSKVCNIAFAEVRSGPAEIRVSFRYGYGSWSLVGRSSTLYDQSQATLNLGWHTDSTPDSEWYVATHECGHALGFPHEHQSPNARIPWDVPKVLRYFRGSPNYWSDPMTYANVIQRLGPDEAEAGPYDRLSIMQYPVDSALTTTGFSVGVNTRVSAGDAARARVWYPFPGDRPAHPQPVMCPQSTAWTVPVWRRVEFVDRE